MTLSPNRHFSMESEPLEIAPVQSFYELSSIVGKTLDERIRFYGHNAYTCNMGKKTQICQGYLIYGDIEMVVRKISTGFSILISRMQSSHSFVITQMKNRQVVCRRVFQQLGNSFCIDSDVIRVTKFEPECSPIAMKIPNQDDGWKLISHPGIMSNASLKTVYHTSTNYFACITCNERFKTLRELAEHYNIPPVFHLDKFREYNAETSTWSDTTIPVHVHTTDINYEKNMEFKRTIAAKIDAYYNYVFNYQPELLDQLRDGRDFIPDEIDELFTY